MDSQIFNQEDIKSPKRFLKSIRASIVGNLFKKKPIAKIFICYSNDKKFARNIQKKLSENNIDTWYDVCIPKDDIDYHKIIEDEIYKSDILLLVADEHSTKSHYVTYEWAFALGKAKSIILLYKEECEIHKRLSTYNFIDFRNRCKWKELINAIKSIRNK